MEHSEATQTTEQSAPDGQGSRLLVNILIKVIIPLLIVVVAVGFTKHQIDTRPKAKTKKPPRQARLVTVETVHVQAMPASIQAMGPVIPAQQVTLMPEVAGRIVSLDPMVIPGGLVSEGQELLGLDPRDYEAAFDQRRGERAQAYLSFKLELGNQKIAQQEYELLGQEVSEDERDLVLRKPHLASAEAGLRAHDAAVERARIDLERCRVVAPFNAVIQDKHVDLGARVSPGSALLTLAGTDQYWIEVKVPVDQLKWIMIPRSHQLDGSTVTIYDRSTWGEGVTRTGRIIRLLASLEPQGRLGRLLVAVDDPLSLQAENEGKAPMLLESYVRVVIAGKELTGGIPVPREWLRDGEKVWVMSAEQSLETRSLTIRFSGKEQVYVTEGLKSGDRIIKTDISAPIEGMPLRVQEDADAPPMPGGDHGRN